MPFLLEISCVKPRTFICDKLISFFLISDRGGLKQHCVLFPFSPLSPSSSPLTEGYTVSGKFNATLKQLHVKRLTACWTFINLRNPFLLVFLCDQGALYALCVFCGRFLVNSESYSDLNVHRCAQMRISRFSSDSLGIFKLKYPLYLHILTYRKKNLPLLML